MKEFFVSKKGKITFITAISVVVVAVVVVIGIQLAGSGYRTIAVEEVIGTVTVNNKAEGLHNAYEGMHLESGDEVTVGENSSLALKLDKDKYVVADAGTHFIVEASGDSENKKNMRTYIYMDSGSILNRLDDKLGIGEIYEVQTPNSTAAVRGTTFRVTVYGEGNGNEESQIVENYTQVEVLKGVVNVELKTEDGKATGEERDIEAGESALIHSNPDISEFVDGTENGETHTEVRNVIKEATCTEDGLVEIRCSECNKFLGAQTIPKTGHTDGEWMITKEADCVQTGKKVLTCAVCEEELDSAEIALTEHNFEESTLSSKNGCNEITTVKRICSVCKKEEVVSEEETESHSFGAWVTERQSTCALEGVSARSCSVCGAKETKSIAKVAHTEPTDGLWESVEEPTCLKAGSRKIACSVCGEWIYKSLYAECHSEYTKDGHDISGVNYSYTSGYQICKHTGICVWCGKEIVETHNLKVDIVVSSDGSETTSLYCTSCGVKW